MLLVILPMPVGIGSLRFIAYHINLRACPSAFISHDSFMQPHILLSHQVFCVNLYGKRLSFLTSLIKKTGLVRDLNPGPLAPKARIIPLDQRASHTFWNFAQMSISLQLMFIEMHSSCCYSLWSILITTEADTLWVSQTQRNSCHLFMYQLMVEVHNESIIWFLKSDIFLDP